MRLGAQYFPKVTLKSLEERNNLTNLRIFIYDHRGMKWTHFERIHFLIFGSLQKWCAPAPAPRPKDDLNNFGVGEPTKGCRHLV